MKGKLREKNSHKRAFLFSSSLTSRAIFFFEVVVVIVLIFSIGQIPPLPSKRPHSCPSRRFLVEIVKLRIPRLPSSSVPQFPIWNNPSPVPLPRPIIALFNIFEQLLKYEFQHSGIKTAHNCKVMLQWICNSC